MTGENAKKIWTVILIAGTGAIMVMEAVTAMEKATNTEKDTGTENTADTIIMKMKNTIAKDGEAHVEIYQAIFVFCNPGRAVYDRRGDDGFDSAGTDE